MSKVRVEGFTLSLDGFAAGPRQRLEAPMGEGAQDLHRWLRGTRTFMQTLFGKEGGSTGLDDEIAARGFENLGAWIIGRNMFGPIRGDWGDADWRGWWGDDPPHHVPVFVLTHHARPSLPMQGGTVFHFVTGGIHEALRLAREAAGPRDIRVGGGADTVRQYLQAGLIDQLHLAIAPTLLGSGERLFEGVDLTVPGYRCTSFRASDAALHVVLERG
ncbi:dihydrofolate reductase family protein [Pseudoxanthomonas winnipegensis]|uniref:dihydrofolate reductase family protein n=1 Tax=Pseudoxanthomonas winnipegensis TaxID=2480810 RepID=UPI0030F40C1E